MLMIDKIERRLTAPCSFYAWVNAQGIFVTYIGFVLAKYQNTAEHISWVE